jgi:biopolymer transport protein ExbD
MINIKKKNIKINIIPLIDIIFLMLVFFMLATNFSEKKEISFKLKQNIETLNDDQENLIIYIKSNSFVINENLIKNSQIEEKVISYWNKKIYKNIIILNDDNSNLQKLIFILDILKKNQIKNVSFADDPEIKI